VKNLTDILKETGVREKLGETRTKHSPINVITKDQLYAAFDVDGDGIVSESDYAAHIAWHLEHPQLFEATIGNLDGDHLEHVKSNEVECASSETEHFGKPGPSEEIEEAKDFSRGSVLPPAMIVMRRLSIRQFSNGEKVALYYAKTINRYLTVPYNENGILDLTQPNNSLSK
jgi:hypothetical protein